MYGAHLVKNGLMGIVNRLIDRGWLTHLATNGAGTIHDWELAYLGRTEESVRENVANGTFGTWDETGRCLHLALLTGALGDQGYGRSLGRFICEDGTMLPTPESLETALRAEPRHPLAPARAELLQAMAAHRLPAGPFQARHPWKESSILARAFARNVPMTAHPGIGYDIISTHPSSTAPPLAVPPPWISGSWAAPSRDWTGASCLPWGRPLWRPQVFERA